MKKYLAIVCMLSVLMGSVMLISCQNTDKSNEKTPSKPDSSDNSATAEGQIENEKENNSETYIDPEPDYSYLTGPAPDYSSLPKEWLTPYTAFVSKSVTDGGTELERLPNLPEQWFAKDGEFVNEEAPDTVTIKIGGEEYTYSYRASQEPDRYSFVNASEIHCYGDTLAMNGNLQLDANTGMVISWQKEFTAEEYRKAYQYDENLITIYSIDTDELCQKAYAYAAELVGAEQAAKYEFVLEEGRVYLYRMINGYKTNEYIYLKMTSDGALWGYKLNNVGLHNDVSDFEFNENKAEAVVKSNIKEAFTDTEYKIKSMNIVVRMLPNGQMAYEYTTEVMYFHKMLEGDREAWSGVQLVFAIPAE